MAKEKHARVFNFLNANISNIKIFIYLIILGIFLDGCSFSGLSKHKNNWQKTHIVAVNAREKLQVGDILITPKDWTNPLSWFGHSALLISKDEVGEYPKLGYGFQQVNIYDWLFARNYVKVLRYKKFDSKFKKQFLININKLVTASYNPFFAKDDALLQEIKKVDLHCSSYIWLAYAKTAKDLGYELDLDSDKGYFVMPYDILYSKQLTDLWLNTSTSTINGNF